MTSDEQPKGIPVLVHPSHEWRHEICRNNLSKSSDKIVGLSVVYDLWTKTDWISGIFCEFFEINKKNWQISRKLVVILDSEPSIQRNLIQTYTDIDF